MIKKPAKPSRPRKPKTKQGKSKEKPDLFGNGTKSEPETEPKKRYKNRIT